ncbi:MAG: HPF/RaiA family ribosome-associated protein [Gemmataceae bacterium]
MHLEIRHHGVDLTQEIRDWLQRRAEFALGRLQDRVLRVWAHLTDHNGPRGGVDKSCRVVVHLPQRPPVVVEDRAENLYGAIDRAVNRAGQVVRRQLGKRASHR